MKTKETPRQRREARLQGELQSRAPLTRTENFLRYYRTFWHPGRATFDPGGLINKFLTSYVYRLWTDASDPSLYFTVELMQSRKLW